MTTHRIDQTLSASDHAALIDAAKRRAVQLRQEAIDEFWSAAMQGLRSAWVSSARLAARALAQMGQVGGDQGRRERHQP